MIGGDADMRGAVLEQLHDCSQHSADCPKRRISLFEAADAVKVSKQFVGAVD
jgi:hypothetical protein